MSMPLGQQQQPDIGVEPFPIHSSSSSSHASIGPVIAVLVVIMILGIVAGMIGRLCSGRTIFGYGDYDIESWAETKFSSCIDGRITTSNTPPPTAVTRDPQSGDNAVASPATTTPTPTRDHEEEEDEDDDDDDETNAAA
ncbi:unnamed protein product [Linum tenue]|uniref:Uncharacterized protein n=1 Tax=Linum tenue TaxID=586396 RepID=A0AAV0RLE6_9ROSI|nr:unnamed protein product [Linum tenue]